MPKTINIGICSVEGCEKPERSIGLCNNHYSLYKKRGSTDYLVRNKRKHPLYGIWNDRKTYGSLSEELLDFWKFCECVGDRPSKDHYLARLDNSKPYAKDNFEWKTHIKRQEGESDKDWYARKWAKRVINFPALNSNKNTFKAVGLSLPEFNCVIEDKLKQQEYCCEICKKTQEDNKTYIGKARRLALDHCHTTGKIRGMLCNACNTSLGNARDSIEILQSMINYLKKYSS